MTEHTPLPDNISQCFLCSTGTPKRKTWIIDKTTGIELLVLKAPQKNAKIGDEIVKRYNSHPTLLARVRELEEALKGFGDDYMTSEQHHPGYVLIPTEQFERIRAALADR